MAARILGLILMGSPKFFLNGDFLNRGFLVDGFLGRGSRGCL